jgi:hypothetical protein
MQPQFHVPNGSGSSSSAVIFEREFHMIAQLDVFRLDSNDVGLWISTVDSLLEAFELIRVEGWGEYVIYSQKSGLRRLYEVTENGNIVFREREDVAIARRWSSGRLQ